MSRYPEMRITMYRLRDSPSIHSVRMPELQNNQSTVFAAASPEENLFCFTWSRSQRHAGGFFLLGRDIRAYERPRTVANRHNSRGVLFMPTKEHSWSSLTYEQWQVMVLDWNALQYYSANPDTLPISTGKQNRKKYIDSIVDSNELGILRQRGTWGSWMKINPRRRSDTMAHDEALVAVRTSVI